MTSRDFCFWLQGYFELNSVTEELTPDQVNMIRNRLNLVLIHEIYPSTDHNDPVKKSKYDNIHEGIVLRC